MTAVLKPMCIHHNTLLAVYGTYYLCSYGCWWVKCAIPDNALTLKEINSPFAGFPVSARVKLEAIWRHYQVDPASFSQLSPAEQLVDGHF